MYVVFTLAYAFITGLTYAGFSAVVLEAIGLGAAATKYSLFASLSNMPIGYMTAIDGWAGARWGPGGMLHTEAAIAVLAVLVFVAVAAASTRPRAQVT
jgi:PAT family beta-lactamase induction signal transducer AmpG